jgi:hypothetical protein
MEKTIVNIFLSTISFLVQRIYCSTENSQFIECALHFQAQKVFRNWISYAITIGYGTTLENFCLLTICEKLRNF